MFSGGAETDPYNDIYSINLETQEVTDLTNTSSAGEWNPDYLSDGRIAYANSAGFNVMDANGENSETIRAFTGKEGSYGVSWPQIQGDLPTLGPETKEEATKLLLRYEPKMRYDSIESFFAMNWHPITEIYFKKSTKESNRLIRSEVEKSEVIAYANPALSSPHLNWEFLKPAGGKYPNEQLVKGGDRLSERTSNEEGALADIEGYEVNASYKDRTYGRVKYDGGRWWLQYWLWYYYQPFLEGFGDHEGDWEMVQIGLNEDGLPELATYAEHSGGESCTFGELPTSIGYYGNLAPDVFVSYGVHASYTNTEHLGVGEVANGAVPVNPQVETMYDTENWVQWPGKWGDSETSPGAPSTQGSKWTSPSEFYKEGGECTSSVSGLQANRVVDKMQKGPSPELHATQAGNVVTVNYRFSEDAKPPPKWILIKVSEAGGIPVGGNYPVHGNGGQVKIEVPFKGNRLVAIAQAVDLEGHSEIVETPVR